MNLIFPLTGQNSPGILAGRVNMCSDSLPRLDMPSYDDSLVSFDNHRSNGLTS